MGGPAQITFMICHSAGEILEDFFICIYLTFKWHFWKKFTSACDENLRPIPIDGKQESENEWILMCFAAMMV
jgi:hypothetical protein